MFQDFSDDNKGDDFLNEFRQKIADQPSVNIEEKRNEMRRSKSVFIGAVSGVALAGIVGYFILAPQYANNANVEIPVIRRPQTAVKVQPSEPGGMEILNQDKSVYDIIERKDNEPKTENLLPPPEQPQMPVIAQAQAAAPEVEAQPIQIASNQLKSNDIMPEKVVGSVSVAGVKEVKPAATAAQTGDAPEAKVIGLKEAVQMENKKIAAQQAQPAVKTEPAVKAEPVAKAEPQKAPAPQKAVAGMWQIQLMSSPNKQAVEKAWLSLSKKYKMLQGLPHEIEAADLDFDKTFYRLKAGAFETRQGADELCKDIKALGGTCIVKKK